jgi:hypothetical protein
MRFELADIDGGRAMDRGTARALARLIVLASIALVLTIGACLFSGCVSTRTTECKLTWRGDCEQQLFKE